MLGLIHGPDLHQCLLLRVRQGLEITHGSQIVRHLGFIAHAGEHHGNLGESGGKPQGVAGGTAVGEQFQGFLGQIHQGAAPDRLHDQDRLAVLLADLIAQSALDLGILIVQVVELQLDKLDLRPCGENLIQHLGGIVEGHAHMAQLPRGLAFQSDLIGMGIPVLFKPGGAHGVHQEEVEVFHAAFFQHQVDEGPDLLFFFEAAGELVRQHIALPGIAVGQALLHRLLALALDVGVGGVEIVEARGQEGIHHLTGGFHVHFFADHGQAHHAEAEVFLNFRKMRVHKGSSCYTFISKNLSISSLVVFTFPCRKLGFPPPRPFRAPFISLPKGRKSPSRVARQ